jgi:hypothetical protein
MESVRTAADTSRRVLHRCVLDLIYVLGVIAVFALLGLLGRAVEKL